MPKCRGRHPHLGRFDEVARACPGDVARRIEQRFPVTISVLSLPISNNQVEQLVAEQWAVFAEVANRENLDFALKFTPNSRA